MATSESTRCPPRLEKILQIISLNISFSRCENLRPAGVHTVAKDYQRELDSKTPLVPLGKKMDSPNPRTLACGSLLKPGTKTGNQVAPVLLDLAGSQL